MPNEKSVNNEYNPANESLRKSEERHRSILRAAMDGFWMVDLEGRLLEVNNAYCRMSGYSEPELLAMRVPDLEIVETGELVAVHMARIIELGQDRFASRHRRKDGSIIDIEVSTQYYAGEEGRVFAFLRDITEQRQANDARRESESFIKVVMDNLPIGIAVNAVDPAVSFQYMNDNFPRLYRTTREALAAPDTFWNAVYEEPDFREEIKKQILDDCASGDPEKMHWVDVPITRTGDRTTYVEARNTLIPDKQLMVSTVWDVTRRKEAELALQQEQELYEDLVNTLPAGAYRLRAKVHGNWRAETWQTMAAVQYSLDYASDLFCSILGITQEALAANPAVVSDSVHPDDKVDFDARNAQAMTDFNPFIWEGRIISNQQTRWVHLESLPRAIDPETVLWTGIIYDITELKQAVKEREQFFKFFRISADLMCLADPDGCFLKTNPAFSETLGYSEAELAAKPIVEFIHPDDKQATLDEIFNQRQRGFTRDFRNRYLCKDGSIKWLSWRVNYSREDGIAYATARDVTEKKRAEEALRENEERMKLAMQAGNMGLYDLNVQTGEAVVNPEYALMLGYDPAEFHETNAQWIERLHPDDREPVAAVYQAYVQGELPHYKVEFRQKTKDGAWKWILSYGRIMARDADGSPRRMLGVHVDISERKEAEEALREREEQLRVIFDTSQAGIILVDPQGTILFANNRMAEMFGMPLSQLNGSSYPEHLYATEWQTGDALMRQLIRGDIQEVAVERHYLRADGSDFWGFLSGKRLVNPDGSLRALVGIIADLTEQKKLQEQLSQAQKMESVGRLAGGVAHDFNNMLNVILGHAELARMKEVLSPPLREHIEQIQKAAERSAAIVRQLLAFARKQTVTPKVLDLNEIVDSMLKMLRRLIGEEIDLVWRPGKELWPVRMDPAQIDQILANLCINARDAIAGVGRITIETGNKIFDAAFCSRHKGYVVGEYVMFIVSDDGSGMDKETRQHIFEPFFTTKGVGQGTGLGLATVYGIVKQNAGFIDVYSEPDQGTSFKIYLPRCPGEEEPAGTARPLEPAARGKETVLLVEDEPAILELGKQLLEMQGYQVLTAATPGEAIRLAVEHHGEIHLLLTDVIMPEMNGRELAKKLLSLYPGLKRLFMSGYTADIIAHHGVLDEGMNFLQKPFSVDALAEKVREALDQC
jgi:PAS domain S-box-containing protein